MPDPIIDFKAWLEREIILLDEFHFEKIGPKRTLFDCRHPGSLASLFIDPPLPDPSWQPLPGLSSTESFFERLKPIVQATPGWWFAVVIPEEEYNHVLWVNQLDSSYWNSECLHWLESRDQSRNEPYLLGVSFGSERSLILFNQYKGFEIAFYGNPETADQIEAALKRFP